MSQELTRIVPVSKSETRDYSDRIIRNIWIERQVSNSDNSTNDLNERITELITNADETICLMIHESCVKLLNHELLTLLSKRIEENKIRTYILCDDLGLLLLQESVFNHVLLREVSNLPEGIMVLTDAQKESAGFLASGSLGFSLSKEQIQTLFIFFCEEFWKEAQKEKLNGKLKNIINNENLSQKLLLKPKDDSILRLNLPQGQYNKSFFYHSIPSTVKVKEELLISLTINVEGYDSKTIRADNKNQGIPFNLMLNDSSSYFSIKYGEQWFTLRLTSEQVNQAEEWFKIHFDKSSHEWSKQTPRKNLVGKTFCRPFNSRKKFTVEICSEINLGEININLNDSNINSQDSLDLIVRPKEEEFKDDGLSLTIKYLWKLKLPKLPKDAQKDPLYKEWEQVSGIDKPESADLEKNLQSLPNVGTLFTKAGKRYLQIQFWEELLEAQREAKRFNNADIVI